MDQVVDNSAAYLGLRNDLLALQAKQEAEKATLIDDFGLLCAQIAELETKKAALREQIVAALGDGTYEGTFFRVTVSLSTRETLNMKAVRDKLSPQFIKAHTKESIVITVKAGARNAINVANELVEAVAA